MRQPIQSVHLFIVENAVCQRAYKNRNNENCSHLIQQHPITLSLNNDLAKTVISISADCDKKIVIFDFDFTIVTAL